ncbi:hypothetical protein [Legionella shakespearei]|uniref:Glycosyl transferase family 2 n=1 Tax=Legionella shakespearei DSM 23087 TaxID=1122169 RepID=A0A0W0YQU8_9GAMM|nr:hypothetical protein [Legionella shakespearei]KTD59276.1 hypothetical protein Lsha_1972 [Legionella shakespearei DSM 23087]
MITVKIASIPERISQLEVTIENFLKKVDEIQVYLNNYSSIPSFLNHKKICVFTSQEYGDIGDIGKFYQIEQQNGYILTIDDDLIYPPDYVDSMVRKIDFYQRKTLICVHGNILPKQKLTSYYKDKQGVHFEKELESDIKVDVPGTGTLGFHTDHIKISREIFLSPNMTDIWLAIYAKENDISIISMKRSKDWLIQARGEAFQRSIYQKSFQKDTYQTSVVNNVFLVE